MSIGWRCMRLGWRFVWPRSPYYSLPGGGKVKLKVIDEVPHFVDTMEVARPAKSANNLAIVGEACVGSQGPDSSAVSDASDYDDAEIESDESEVTESGNAKAKSDTTGLAPNDRKSKSQGVSKSQVSGVDGSVAEWTKVDGQVLPVSESDKQAPAIMIEDDRDVSRETSSDQLGSKSNSNKDSASESLPSKQLSIPVPKAPEGSEAAMRSSNEGA